MRTTRRLARAWVVGKLFSEQIVSSREAAAVFGLKAHKSILQDIHVVVKELDEVTYRKCARRLQLNKQNSHEFRNSTKRNKASIINQLSTMYGDADG